MRIVLDTNEYIFALGVASNPSSRKLFEIILDLSSKISIHLPRTIINEVRDNLSPQLFSEFLKIVRPFASIDEDIVVPFEIGAKYEALGLKPADAFIAAYTEWAGADLFISENRHFLANHTKLPFKVVNAAKALTLLSP